MPTRKVKGVTFVYSETGQGTALVLVHGFPLDRRIWEDQLVNLSADCRVVAPDLRGFGDTHSDTPFTIESLADDLHMLLDDVGLPCVLGGLSMGGYVALAFARKYPTDLLGLVLVDTRAEADTPEGKQGRQKMIDLARTSGSSAVADQMMPKMTAPGLEQRRPEVAGMLRSIMNDCPPKTIEHALAAMRDRPDLTGFLPSIKVPTLVIVGDADAITPVASAEAMQRAIPNATLTVITGAGHMSPMEEPAQVNHAIGGFLKEMQ
jgi:pimeloyl-ACP methyl ester carboxylesterase